LENSHTMTTDAFHERYRPKTLERIIGHEQAVKRLMGIVEKEKYPSAMLFAGPSSAGKTTLARAFANAINGKAQGHPDYLEQNGAMFGKKEDMIELLSIAQLLPQQGKRRIIMIDEAQKLSSAAEHAILKPLENPPPKTIFIIASMEPEKLSRALVNRCSPFILQSHPKENIVKFLKRIAKAEELDYLEEKHLNKIANNSNGEMRTAANLIEAVSQSAGKKAKNFSSEDLEQIFATALSKDDEIAVEILRAVYARKFSVVQLKLLEVADPFTLINKMIWLNNFVTNDHVLQGQRHNKVWWSKNNQRLKDHVNELRENKKLQVRIDLTVFGLTNVALVQMKQQAQSFLVGESNLISSHLFLLIQQLKEIK